MGDQIHFKNSYLFLYVYWSFAFMYACIPHVCVCDASRGIIFLTTVVADSCELLCRYRESNSVSSIQVPSELNCLTISVVPTIRFLDLGLLILATPIHFLQVG